MAKAKVAAPTRVAQVDPAHLLQEAEELEALILALEAIRVGEIGRGDMSPGRGIVNDFTPEEADGRLQDLRRILGFEAAGRAVALRRAIKRWQTIKAVA